MRNVLSCGRAILFVCAVLAAVFLYFLTISRTQNAQERAAEPEPLTEYKKFAQRDLVTDDIRSPRKELVRVAIKSEADRSAASAYGTVVQDFGSFAVVAKDKGSKISGLETQKIGEKIHLPGATFDPISSPPQSMAQDAARSFSADKGYYVVQFGGVATDEWLNSIRDAGVEILQYVPDQAFFVYGDSAAISRVAAHSRVRWVGEFSAEQRIPKSIRERVTAAKAALAKDPKAASQVERAIFDVAVFSRASLKVAENELAKSSTGRVLGGANLPNNFFNIIRVELPVTEIEQLANLPDVVRVDAYVPPSAEDERSSQIIAGNYTGPSSISGPGYNPAFQFGVDGNGVTVMVSDDGVNIPGNGGLYLTAGNVVDGPLRGSTTGASKSHGHLNASIIAGAPPSVGLDPLQYSYGMGVAPRANIVNIPWLKPNYPFLDPNADARAIDDALNTAGPNGVRASISNHSWGDGVNSNAYDSYAALYDGLVRDGSFAPTIDPFTIIFSAGNCGFAPLSEQCIPPGGQTSQTGLTRPHVAKNIIAVGSSENLRSEFTTTNGISADNMEDLDPTTSRGPAADGRIKPDIIAPGVVVTGSRAGDCTLVSTGGCFDANHVWSRGTSHAAPQISGAAALFTHAWKNEHSGQNPSPAMVKAAILSSGQDMSGANAGAVSVPNGVEGWGRINMKYMIDRAALIQRLDQASPLLNVGDSITLNGSVSDPSRPIRVALVWSDPPAVADPALVNNLDLQVTVGGTTYKGNVFSGGLSTTGGSFDSINNVEQVWLPAGIANGTAFSIVVTAAALNGNGILSNADATDQDFALVAYNFSEAPPVSFYTVAGQLVSQSGRGVPKGVVYLTGQDGIPRMTVTNPFGFFRFSNVAGGRSYTVSVNNKRATFNPQNLTVNGNIDSLVLTSVAGGP